jgi:hypothetical protein
VHAACAYEPSKPMLKILWLQANNTHCVRICDVPKRRWIRLVSMPQCDAYEAPKLLDPHTAKEAPDEFLHV